MRLSTITTILICVMSSTAAIPNILKDTWDVLTKYVPTAPECPDQQEPPYIVNIPHESHCGMFYICQEGRKIEMTCSPNLQFNAKTKACDWPRNAKCRLDENNVRYSDAIDSEQGATPANGTVENGQIECAYEDQHVPHENHCNQYYRCVYGRKVLKTCPGEMVFNKERSACDFGYNVVCGSLKIIKEDKRDVVYLNFEDDYVEGQNNITSIKNYVDYDYYDDFLDAPPDTPKEPPAIKCPNETNLAAVPVLLPHEENCNAYYRCSRGEKLLLFCPGMLQFNPELSVCDWPRRAKCKKRNTFSTTQSSVGSLKSKCRRNACRDSTVYLPNPDDPKKFIRCDNGKEIHEYCPNGLVFDAKLRVCNLAP